MFFLNNIMVDTQLRIQQIDIEEKKHIHSSWLAHRIFKNLVVGSGQIEYPKNQRSPLEILQIEYSQIVKFHVPYIHSFRPRFFLPNPA